ncbi:MAG: DUF721 domain-containing protein [Sandaracinus sp.]|nr:DUF721 domain-containing protein [Myxococcales bacterium]MCB9619383.1 DUF721 domain-containing protein [Sandaracinus sp.]MCB9636575.1 DUF721 domain-containing protein [Sandaracinus sp.]
MPRIRRRRKSQLLGIAELIRRVHPAPEQVDEARVFGFWLSALPEKIVMRARPTRLMHGILHVNVSSSAWAQELHHMHDDLLERLRAHAPHARLHAIRFRVGPLPELPTFYRPKPPKPRAVAIARLPEELGRALANVHDDALRQKIAAAASMSLREEPDVRVRKR